MNSKLIVSFLFVAMVALASAKTFEFSMSKANIGKIQMSGATLNVESETFYIEYYAGLFGKSVNVQMNDDLADVRFFLATGYHFDSNTEFTARLSGSLTNLACLWIETNVDANSTNVLTLPRTGNLLNGQCSDGERTISWATVSDFFVCANNSVIGSETGAAFQVELTKSKVKDIYVSGSTLNLDTSLEGRTQYYARVADKRKDTTLRTQMNAAGVDVSYFATTGYDFEGEVEYTVRLSGDNSDHCIWVETNAAGRSNVVSLPRLGNLTIGTCEDSTRRLSWGLADQFLNCAGEGNANEPFEESSGASALLVSLFSVLIFSLALSFF